MSPDRVRLLALRHPWIWPALGVLLLWIGLSVLTQRVSLHALSGVATSAAFLLIAALGQMVVVTTGRGNIDLSIPSVMTLAAFATVTVSGSEDANLPLTLAALLGLGLVTGLVNGGLVVLLRIPAIIATLATGYMLATLTLLVNRQMKSSGTAEWLDWLATGRLAGVPVVALLALLVMVALSLTLTRTVYGRQLSATGQSWNAARLAGVPVARTTVLAFLTSALLATLSGSLLSAYAGGAFLEMGSPYLLQTVGAVVLGGTIISGGSAAPLGTLFGTFLLILIIVTMQIAGLPLGAQDIVQGVVIIMVLALVGPGSSR
jgi:ribose transport system permease protein